MFDPQAVINQARQGQIPETWQVFQGKRPSPALFGCFIGFIVLLIMSACGVLATILTLIVLNIQHAQTNVSKFILIAVAVVLAIASLAGILAYLRRRRDVEKPDPLLVVTPEGIVECFLPGTPPSAVSFAELETIMVQLDAKISRSGFIRSLRLRLELHYPDGKVKRWRPQAIYKEPEELISASIMDAYDQYVWPQKSQKSREPQLKPPKKLRKRRKR